MGVLMDMLGQTATRLLNGVRPNPNVIDFVKLDVFSGSAGGIGHVESAETNESVATTDWVLGRTGPVEVG